MRDWDGTDEAGRELILRIFRAQELIGFSIPILLYLLALSLGASAVLATIAAMAYFTDVRSVAFQYVVLHETLSIALMLLAMLLFVRSVKSASYRGAIVCGLVTSLAVVVRPPLAVPPVILCATLIVWNAMQRRS